MFWGVASKNIQIFCHIFCPTHLFWVGRGRGKLGDLFSGAKAPLELAHVKNKNEIMEQKISE